MVPYYTERDIRITATLAVGSVILKRDRDDTAYTQSRFSDVKVVSVDPSSIGLLQTASKNDILRALAKKGVDIKNFDSVKNGLASGNK